MDQLQAYVERALAQPVDPTVASMAEYIRDKCRNVQAIYTYGSTLRGVPPSETLIDYYVTVSKTEDYAVGPFARLWARMAPPNVYYAEHLLDGVTIRAKYAVIPAGELWHRVRPSHANPYFWVRFCQPMRLVYAASDTARQQANSIVCDAMTTAFRHATGLVANGSAKQKWTALFIETYGTEFRPEKTSRASEIVTNQIEHFDSIDRCLPAVEPFQANWRWQRIRGKALTILRLMKATTTFAAGADYVVWKIERHSGQRITLTPWQRKHPLAAGLLLLPRLLTKGTIR